MIYDITDNVLSLGCFRMRFRTMHKVPKSTAAADAPDSTKIAAGFIGKEPKRETGRGQEKRRDDGGLCCKG